MSVVRKYRFGEAVLPEIPGGDDGHPHCLIMRYIDGTGYLLYFSDSPFFAKNADGISVCARAAEAELLFRLCTENLDDWGPETIYEAETDEMGDTYRYFLPEKLSVAWTGTDIADDSGSVVWAASEPQFLWEFCRESFQLGIAVGLGLKGWRKEVDTNGSD